MAHHSIDIRRIEGDDAICTAHIDDWSCLVLQSADPDLIEVELIHGIGTEHDVILVIPSLLLQSMGDKINTVLPRLIGFAYEHEM